MSIIFLILGAIFLYFFSRGIVFYHTFFSITSRAYYIANIEPIRARFIIRTLEKIIVLVSSPIVGFGAMHIENANDMMLNAFRNTANKFSDRENARNFLKAAEEIWEEQLKKEKA